MASEGFTEIASILFVPSLIVFDHEVVEFSTLKHLHVILFWGPWVPFSSYSGTPIEPSQGWIHIVGGGGGGEGLKRNFGGNTL